ncbi:DNA recombination protein RmuC [Beijerinckiaceae bacterium RH AL1]|nr:DNA recombination protein RmuC [Beijerinckiaceae bacterium]VVB44053.1 DNA recombination protein RmuC [Beijerinckiaceae bacterium RH CH11]VVB44080.1 DNA recombination protein RmuC [Beijerinckiaceae bacterium RH AL8]VVC54147.1 DNA recombination protein RmuC [Beijerinckiaceae bacterium RH AL1]
MDRTLLVVAGHPITGTQMLVAALAAAALLALGLVVALIRAGATRAEREAAEARHEEIESQMTELSRSSIEMTARLQTVAEVFGSRQADLARLVSERLDAVGHRLGQGLETSSRAANENLGKLNERLAVIDAAQSRLTDLTREVLVLKDILANKQARGAFGQGRMEAIIRDALPASAYEFQHTLSNRSRPDCCIRLPGDDRMMVVDAKFPLEAFSALKSAAGDEAAAKAAAARVRTDVTKHIRDIAERYFVPGETQDIAILFVPSESLYGEINETFEDLVAKAHKARIIIVSPSLLMMAVQVMQAIVRDARVREQAHVIQTEVRNLVADVSRLHERVSKLQTHFKQVDGDVTQALTSSEKILKRGERIDAMDFSDAEQQARPFIRAAE